MCVPFVGANQVLKWNFTAPRDEHVQQLSEQMKGCVGKKLHSLLFSDDFRAHSKALDALIDCVKTPEGGKAFYGAEAESCFDLLLKWTTLRFLETNPKVLLKAMTFVKVSSIAGVTQWTTWSSGHLISKFFLISSPTGALSHRG